MPVYLVPGDFLDGSGNIGDLSRVKIMTVEQLLPEGFGPEHLQLPRNKD